MMVRLDIIDPIKSMICRMKARALGAVLLAVLCMCTCAAAQVRVRDEIRIPDIPGYRTLKCDLHMHTVYSDGEVLPRVRVEEAWRNGLDAISITDHIEYFIDRENVQETLDKLYRPARMLAEELGITFINGTEITLDMPPGHFSAIFLKDTGALIKQDWRKAFEAAHAQGAFIFWNHPGWYGQQPDGVSRWYTEHTEIFENGWMHGIEIVNKNTYYPNAHGWCLEKKLTMIASSDAHEPVPMIYDEEAGESRPVTLVFATENSPRAIEEALRARRTVVLLDGVLIGEERFLRPIFDGSISVLNPEVSFSDAGRALVRIYNDSDIDYELTARNGTSGVSTQPALKLAAGKTALLTIAPGASGSSEARKIKLPFTAENLMVSPGEGLPVEIEITVNNGL